MVTSVVSAREFEQSVVELATALAHGPTVAFALMKQNFARVTSADLATFLDHEARSMVDGMETEDFARAADAFLHGTPPLFEGR